MERTTGKTIPKGDQLIIGLVLLVSLLWTALAQAGDVYIYQDAQGRKHLSNVLSNDPTWKLVKTIVTPKYKKPPPSKIAKLDQTEAVGRIKIGDSGWKLIRPSVSDYLSGSSSVAALGSRKPFRINEANRKRYSRAIEQAAKQYGVDANLVHAVISAESGFNPRALSPAGAMGLMQLMPATAERFGVANAFDPVANIRGGTRYLRWLLKHFKDNIRLALAGYNAGENAVIKYGYKIPPYKETQAYVPRVLQFYNHYRGQRVATN